MLRLFISLIMLSLLAGCGPVYKREYKYVPPRSSMGKMCIAQCVQAKSSCEQLCQLRNQNCVTQARQDALYQYENYRHEMLYQGKPIEKSVSDFDRGYTCSSTCNCKPSFNTCYAACGGQVLEREVCVAFCDKK